MNRSLLPPVGWMLLFGITFYVSSAYTRTYPFKDHCIYSNYKIDDDDTIYITYDGELLDRYSCSIGFYGGGDDVFDEFKVCVEPITFQIGSCGIQVVYSKDIWFNDRTYSCNQRPTKFCVTDGDFLHIDIKNANRNTDAKFKLKVYAVKTYDYSTTVGIIAGIVIGGLVLCSAIVTVIIVCACKKTSRNNAGRVITQDIPQGYSAVGYTTAYPTAPPQYPEPQGVYNTHQQYNDSLPSYYDATTGPKSTVN